MTMRIQQTTNPRVQRKCGCTTGGDCGCGGKKKIQRKARVAEDEVFEREADRVAEQVPAGTAQPLSYYERTLGHDFSRVRIHDDAHAHAMANAEAARAFTYGSDIYFARGELARADASRLVAHELAHTVQQGAAQTIRRKATSQYAQLRAAIEAKNTNQALTILQALDAATLRDTVDRMDADGLTDQLFAHTNHTDAATFETVLQDVQSARRRVYKDLDSPSGTRTVRDSCTPEQRLKLDVVSVRAASWVDLAVKRVDEFRATPATPANAAVGALIQHYFKTSDAEYVTVLRDRLDTIRTQIRANTSIDNRRCAAPTDVTCDGAAAYAQGGRLVFCQNFVARSDEKMTPTFVHEAAHAYAQNLASSATTADEAYLNTRLFRYLTREEAFNNADTYAAFVTAAAGERFNKVAPPADDIDCGASTEQVGRAIAHASRWNDRTISTLGEMTDAAFTQRFSSVLPTPAPTRSEMLRTYAAAAVAARAPLHITCATGDKLQSCPGMLSFWKNAEQPPRLYVCPSFLQIEPEAQVFEAYRMLFQFATKKSVADAKPYTDLVKVSLRYQAAARLPLREEAPRVLPQDETSYWWLVFLVLQARRGVQPTDDPLVEKLLHDLGEHLRLKHFFLRFNAPVGADPRYDAPSNTLTLPPRPWPDEGRLLLAVIREAQAMRFADFEAGSITSAKNVHQSIKVARAKQLADVHGGIVDVLVRAKLLKNDAAGKKYAAELGDRDMKAAQAEGPTSIYPLRIEYDGAVIVTDAQADDFYLGRLPAGHRTYTAALPWLRAALRGPEAVKAFRNAIGPVKVRVFHSGQRIGELDVN